MIPSSRSYPIICNNELYTVEISKKNEEKDLSWLLSIIESKFPNANLCNPRAAFTNRLLKTSARISYLKDLFPIRISIKPQHSIMVFLKQLDGKSIPILVSQSETIEAFMNLVSEKTCMPPESFHLLYGGYSLKVGKVFTDYGVKNGSTMFMVCELRGGGHIESKFADISDKSLLKDFEFSDTAPKYRKAINGLNLEGYCENPDCEANGKMVVIGIGDGTFDLIEDQEYSLCPLCKKFVSPITCAFTNCEYSFTGTKKEKPSSPPINFASTETSEVGNIYQRYCPMDDKGLVIWIRLKFHVNVNYSNTKEYSKMTERKFCEVCRDSTDIKKTKCGHYYHDKCSKKIWKIMHSECVYCRKL